MELDVTMRHDHRAGEKLFIDYAGKTIEITDRLTGEIRKAQIFVAVLGASNYTYAEATLSQQLEDWIGSHVRAFNYFGGVPEVIVPDNLKSGVTKACRYEPDLNPTPTMIWRVTTKPWWSLPGSENHGTRPRQRPEFCWWNRTPAI